MDNKEIVRWLESLKHDIGEAQHGDLWYYEQAIDMAIEALKAEPTKAVPPSLADVYKWERDIALSQLEEYGIVFAEKKRDDLVEVVLCKDCRWYGGKCKGCNRSGGLTMYPLHEYDYCSYSKRREE